MGIAQVYDDIDGRGYPMVSEVIEDIFPYVQHNSCMTLDAVSAHGDMVEVHIGGELKDDCDLSTVRLIFKRDGDQVYGGVIDEPTNWMDWNHASATIDGLSLVVGEVMGHVIGSYVKGVDDIIEDAFKLVYDCVYDGSKNPVVTEPIIRSKNSRTYVFHFINRKTFTHDAIKAKLDYTSKNSVMVALRSMHEGNTEKIAFPIESSKPEAVSKIISDLLMDLESING